MVWCGACSMQCSLTSPSVHSSLFYFFSFLFFFFAALGVTVHVINSDPLILKKDTWMTPLVIGVREGWTEWVVLMP